MANFNYLDFFKVPTSEDRSLFIKDINNKVVWTIQPFKISSTISNILQTLLKIIMK